MFWSEYNTLYESKKHGFLIHNTLSNSFVEVEEELYENLKQIEQNKMSIASLDLYIIEALKKQRFVVNNKDEDFFDIKIKTHQCRYQKETLALTIAPTTRCNFKCVYCFEDIDDTHSMDDKVVSKVIEFINKRSIYSSNLNIQWYGGEPLMEFNKIVQITNEVKPLFKNYSASIITNGYLLTPEKIELFNKLGISHIQVTLDGPEDIHNKRRPLKNGKGTFEQILSNIDYLFSVDEKTHVRIRVNIDKSNEKMYGDIYKYLGNRFQGRRLSVYAGFVREGNSVGCKSMEDKSFDHQDVAKFHLRNFNENNIYANFLPAARFNECLARNINGFLIDPRGDLYKCWIDIGDKDFKIGNVFKPEIVNKDVLTKYLTGLDQLEDEECWSCKILPICAGGCVKDRINKIENGKNVDYCHPMKNNIESFLDAYYQIKKENKKTKSQ